MPRIFHPIASCFACVGQVVGQMKKRRQFPFASALTFSPFAPYFLTTLRSIRNQKFEHLTQKTAENGGFPKKIGPSDRIRTCGILLPKQARYQLRYTRIPCVFRKARVLYQISPSCARFLWIDVFDALCYNVAHIGRAQESDTSCE